MQTRGSAAVKSAPPRAVGAMAGSTTRTTFSSQARVVTTFGDEPEWRAYEPWPDYETVLTDEGSRWAAYAGTWTVLPEEKRLDLRNHARIAGAGAVEGALQGLDDLCSLFDDGDGYHDASIDLADNQLGTLGVEEPDERWKDERGSGHFCPAPLLTVYVAENILTNAHWGFSGLSVADNALGTRSQLGFVRFAECLRDRFATRGGERLKNLDLSGNQLLGTRGHRMLGMKALVKCFKRSPDRGCLLHLNLARNELHHEGARFLTEMLGGSGLNRLEVLDVSDNYLCVDASGKRSDFAFVDFAQAILRHPTLTAVDVSRNAGFGDEGAEALLSGAIEGVSGMRRLRFGGNAGCGARTVRHLVDALCLSRTLTDVDLCDLDIPRPSLYDLVDALPRCSSITALDLSGNGRAFVGYDPLLTEKRYRIPASARLLSACRVNTSLVQLRLCRLAYQGEVADPHDLAAVSRALRANRCLPLLAANPFKWDINDAGDALHEVLRKLCFLEPDTQRALRSNASLLRDADARGVVDAVAPPSHKCLMTDDERSFRKLNGRNPIRKFAARRIQTWWFAHGHSRDPDLARDPASTMTAAEAAYERAVIEAAARLHGRTSVADLGTRKSNFWGKWTGPHRRQSQRPGVYPERKRTIGPHRRGSQRASLYPDAGAPGDADSPPGRRRASTRRESSLEAGDGDLRRSSSSTGGDRRRSSIAGDPPPEVPAAAPRRVSITTPDPS